MTRIRNDSAGKGKRFTIFSLTLLSKSSNAVWTPFLWKDVILTSKNLHCFFRALKRIPELGNFVREIYFLTFSEARLSTEYLPDGSMDIKSMLSKCSDQVNTQGSLALKPFDDILFPNFQLSSNLSVPTIQRHRIRCSTARARILDLIPNLERLEVGEDLMLPFAKRIGQDARALQGLTANLKELKIDFNKQADVHLISSINAIWLLCLPKLKSAHLYVFVKKSEIKFFNFHQSAFFAGKTNVTSLGLRLESRTLVEGGGEMDMVIRSFINTTKNLVYCSINPEGGAFVEPQHLKNSISTLKHLKVKGGALRYSNIRVLVTLSNVKALSFDSNFLSYFFDALKRSFEASTKPEVLPPGLKKLNLTDNIFPSQQDWMRLCRAFQEEGQPKRTFPESKLASLILWVSLPVTLKSVNSYRRHNLHRAPQSLSDAEKEAFEFAREHLRMASSQKKVRFILLDDLLSDDTH